MAPRLLPLPPTITIVHTRNVVRLSNESGAIVPMRCAQIAPASPISAPPSTKLWMR